MRWSVTLSLLLTAQLKSCALQVLPRIQDSPEFLALADDEARRTAFDKFIKRQKVCSISPAISVTTC
jgi:S-adenosylmethionine:diacylglycerol 3-amino-3-carboxypropyl transferase